MSVIIGKMNSLQLVRTDDKGGFLDAEDYGEVFLPLSQIGSDTKIGDYINVFCYLDDNRLTVTAKRPRALRGELAKLTVKDCTEGAAYLEWGIRKDLMVPFKEQREKMQIGKDYIVYVAMDREQRLYGTTKFNKYIADALPKGIDLKAGDKVDLIAVSKTPLGVKMVINNCVYGLLSAEDVRHSELRMGVKIKGYIKSIRLDGKINISLYSLGQNGVISGTDIVLNALKKANGFLSYNDKTDANVIDEVFNMSKGKFKKIIGGLYKLRKIEILDNGIRLLSLEDKDIKK
ncbi:MAG: S1 RNA-binding domain-containing protein [Succinivibrionaceae bacterium]